MKKINVIVSFDNVHEPPEVALKKKAEFFILLAEMKKEREENK